MSVVSLVVLLFLLSLFEFSQSQTLPPSPCPSKFGYENDGYKWYGVLLAPHPPKSGVVTLKVKLSVAKSLTNRYVGKVELYDDRETTMVQILGGKSVKYKIEFPVQSPLPYLVSAVFNNKAICSGPKARGSYVTNVELEHSLHLGTVNQLNARDPPVIYPQYAPVQAPAPVAQSAYEGCGTVARNPIALIVHGEQPEREEWPWLVALFKRKLGGLEFMCGASLISERLVVTAAHCVTNSDKQAVKPESIILRMGVYNIDDWSDSKSVTRTAAYIYLNNFFKGQKFNNDIAAVALTQSVEFTDYIRPVCLWQGGVTQEEIYNKEGYVVGWGRDEEGARVTSEPKMIKVPVVSTTVCRASNPNFFYLTSHTTLCAGGRRGAGPCTGDSGGGLYMRQGQRWSIRGIVSNALRSESNSCNLYEYVIYTDCAQYISWLNTL